MDEIVFDSDWVKVKKTPRNFYFLERKGVNSIAVLLYRITSYGPECLVRYQPMPLDNSDDMKTYPCPITGGMEEGEEAITTVVREVKEEAGYAIADCREITNHGSYYVGTQTNEEVFIFSVDVTGLGEPTNTTDGSVHEKASINVWEPLDKLKEHKYSGLQILYYKLKDYLKEEK